MKKKIFSAIDIESNNDISFFCYRSHKSTNVSLLDGPIRIPHA